MSIRVIIPDSHGSYIDKPAARAFLSDLRRLDPSEIVMLGDHVDCSGWLSKHARSFTDEALYSYEEDLDDTRWFLDEIQDAAPSAAIDYLEGNHEYHVERLAAELIPNERDARAFVEANAPQFKLKLEERGIQFWSRKGRHMGLPFPNVIRRGRCYFTHGAYHGKNATRTHLVEYGCNLVHGHNHQAAEATQTTIKGTNKAWGCGTLAQKQPLYLHNTPSNWSHGYAFQSVLKSGIFQHVNVVIENGRSLLAPMLASMN